MRLLFGLVLRVVVIASFCLLCAAAWVFVGAHRSVEAETAASAERTVRALTSHVWLGSGDGETKIESPAWDAIGSADVIAPGFCVILRAGGKESRSICRDVNDADDATPAWFVQIYEASFGPSRPVARPFIAQQQDVGSVVATPIEREVIRQTWHQVRLVSDVAAGTVVAVTLLACLGIGLALLPTLTILAGLRALGRGELDSRLPHFRGVEFNSIAAAINDLAERLARMTAERTQLTQRLFQVQEDERRSLARELHDEFGQCLTATAALAAAIEMGAGKLQPELQPELVEDARSIAQNTARMMTKLKSALALLRPPDLDELGFPMSLRQLVSRCNAAVQPGATITLETVGNLASVPDGAALSLYRIAQECLTNAVRHGKPSEVRVRVTLADDRPAPQVHLEVEDDGGGDPARITRGSGFGILGMRERVVALGGVLDIARGRAGLRVSTTIPIAAAGVAGPVQTRPGTPEATEKLDALDVHAIHKPA